jgi:hypothetical protein
MSIYCPKYHRPIQYRSVQNIDQKTHREIFAAASVISICDIGQDQNIFAINKTEMYET